MSSDLERRTTDKVAHLVGQGPDWVTLVRGVSELVNDVIPFTRTCWHSVDPGTILFTGSVNQGVSCSGSWLAEHEYVIDDVNRWWFLARGSHHVGSDGRSTHGDLSRSARHRSREGYGIGDELRVSFVRDGVYWGAASFLREEGASFFDERDIALLSGLGEVIAEGLRRSMLTSAPGPNELDRVAAGPGVVVFDEHGQLESISPAAEMWIAEMIEVPAPADPSQSKAVQAVAARARSLLEGQDPLGLEARSRVRTRTGRWLLLYGTRLSGAAPDRVAVVLQPATGNEVAPLVALAYDLTDRECQVTRLCMQGRSTKQMAQDMQVSAYTVQDHLKAIFAKTRVRSRGELVGQIFLEHYVPRWEEAPSPPPGWLALGD
ncbi:MAG TPA: helix-turn-helix transcriptional regulator [Nocardioidaceae bacterium]|nr:helix-turn-helix transcriptional regulator [Nocardioidaceae bacterium]